MSWQEIANSQRAMMEQVAAKLSVLHPETQKNPALAEIYAGIHKAYESGMTHLARLEKDMSEADNVPHGGSIPANATSNVASVPDAKKRGAIELWATAQTLILPFDTYRVELNKQSQEVVKKLSQLLATENTSIEDDLRLIGQMIASFGTVEVKDPKKTSWLQTFAKYFSVATLGVVGGWFANEKKDTIKGLLVRKKPVAVEE